jgi:hypothetical protein
MWRCEDVEWRCEDVEMWRFPPAWKGLAILNALTI